MSIIIVSIPLIEVGHSPPTQSCDQLRRNNFIVMSRDPHC